MATQYMKDKPTAEDFQYAYVETADGALVRVSKEKIEEMFAGEGVTVDSELSETSENPVQNKVVAEKFSQLSEEIEDLKGSEVTDISAELTTALRTYFANIQTLIPQLAFVTESNVGNTVIQNAKNVVSVLGGGEAEEVMLTNISVSYTGGDVTVGTSLTSLTGITVTATYSDGSTASVTGYTLSGEIVEGNNTITVTYEGLTATFTVTGIVESTIVTYTVTNNLTNVTTDNPVATITENSGYTANLTPDTDCEYDTVTVTMGGVDITSTTYSNGVIAIESVTGDVVITAVAVEVSEEVVLLNWIATDEDSYIDTGVIPEKASYKYVLGMQYPENISEYGDSFNNVYIGGVTQRDNTALASANYWDFIIKSHSNKDEIAVLAIEGIVATLNNYYTSFIDTPVYFAFTDGEQGLYLDEELTTLTHADNSVANTVDTVSYSSSATFDESKHPIYPIWLGRINHNSGTLNSTVNSYLMTGIKFYCFKVFDENGELMTNLRPAKQGSKIGMYDTVTQKFHENQGTGTFSYEEVSE